jgi:hypothetical protein
MKYSHFLFEDPLLTNGLSCSTSSQCNGFQGLSCTLGTCQCASTNYFDSASLSCC